MVLSFVAGNLLSDCSIVHLVEIRLQKAVLVLNVPKTLPLLLLSPHFFATVQLGRHLDVLGERMSHLFVGMNRAYFGLFLQD